MQYFNTMKNALLAVFELAYAISEAEKRWWNIIFLFKYWVIFKKNVASIYSISQVWENMDDKTRFYTILWASETYGWETNETKKAVKTAIYVWEAGKTMVIIFKRYADKKY